MPVPKKRRSKAKKRTKKACWKIDMPCLNTCTNCGRAILPHRACPECGFYKGQQVLQIKDKTSSKKES